MFGVEEPGERLGVGEGALEGCLGGVAARGDVPVAFCWRWGLVIAGVVVVGAEREVGGGDCSKAKALAMSGAMMVATSLHAQMPSPESCDECQASGVPYNLTSPEYIYISPNSSSLFSVYKSYVKCFPSILGTHVIASVQRAKILFIESLEIVGGERTCGR